MSKRNLTQENNGLPGMLDGENQETVGTYKHDSGKTIDNQIEKIEETPFESVKLADGEYSVKFGKFLITSKKFHSHKEAARYTKQIDWQMVMSTVGIYVDEVINELKSLRKEVNNE